MGLKKAAREKKAIGGFLERPEKVFAIRRNRKIELSTFKEVELLEEFDPSQTVTFAAPDGETS